MKLTLQKITLSNFRSFQGEHSINIPQKGLISITGAYKDNPALSNGAGKTTLIMAINHLLLINELPATELQNWYSEMPYYVTGSFLYDDEELEITRGPGLFKINFKNKEILGEEAKTYLKQLLIDPSILEKLIYRKQQSEGIFLPLTSSERYNFLFQIIDLHRIENIIENSKKIINQSEKELIEFNFNKKSLDEKKSFQQQQITRINEQIEELNKRTVYLASKLNDLKEPDEEKYKVSLNHLHKHIDKINAEQPQRERFIDNDLLLKIENEIDELKNGILFTPDEEYTKRTFSLNEQVEELKIHIRSTQTDFDVIKEIIDDKEGIILKNQSVISNYNFQFEPLEIKSQYEQCIVHKTQLMDKLSSISLARCPECSSIVSNENADRLKEKTEKEITQLQDVISFYENNKSSVEECIALENEINLLCNEIEILNREKNESNLKLLELNHKLNYIKQTLENCKNTVELEYKSLQEKKTGKLNLLYNQAASNKERFTNDYLTANNKWLTELNKAEKSLNDQINKNKELYQKEKNLYENSKIEFQTKNDSNKNEIERALATVANFNKEILILQNNISDTINNIARSENQIKIENEICGALGKGGFSGAYLVDILNYLTELTNNNLNSMPIMDRFSIMIDSEKLLKNQNIKPDIDVKIFSSGKEISYKSLSGGQKQSLNWATDQAIDKLITEKYDKSFSWQVLDEPFSALDLVSKQSAIQMLSKSSKDKAIFITDHSKFISDNLDGEIKIIFDNNGSHFELPNS